MTINEDTVKLMATYLSKGILCATIKNNKADLFVLSQVGCKYHKSTGFDLTCVFKNIYMFV